MDTYRITQLVAALVLGIGAGLVLLMRVYKNYKNGKINSKRSKLKAFVIVLVALLLIGSMGIGTIFRVLSESNELADERSVPQNTESSIPREYTKTEVVSGCVNRTLQDAGADSGVTKDDANIYCTCAYDEPTNRYGKFSEYSELVEKGDKEAVSFLNQTRSTCLQEVGLIAS